MTAPATARTSSRSGSWTTVHRRGEVLRAVVDAANARRDGSLPTDVPGVAETFADDFDLVAALQLRWHTRLAGTIERMLMDSPEDAVDAVLAAWHRTAVELAGVRQILDTYTARPTSEQMATAFATARRKDWVLMAAMSGLAGTAGQAPLHAGRELERRARATYDPATEPGKDPGKDPATDTAQPRHRGDTGARPTLLDRIKAVLAA